MSSQTVTSAVPKPVEQAESPNRYFRRRILYHLRPYRTALAATIFLRILSALSEAIGLSLFIPLLTVMIQREPLTSSPSGGFMGAITNVSLMLGITEIWQICLILFGIVVVKNILSFLGEYLSALTHYRLVGDLQHQFIVQFMRLDFSYINQLSMGQLVQTFYRQTYYCGMAFGTALQMVTQIGTITIYIVLLLLISPEMTVLAAIMGIVVSALNSRIIGATRERARQLVEMDHVISKAAHEMLSGIRVIRSYAQSDREIQRMRTLQDNIYARRLSKQFFQNLPGPITEVTTVAIVIVMLILSTNLYEGQGAVVVLTFLFVLVRLLPDVMGLNSSRAKIAGDFHNVMEVTRFLDTADKPYMANGTRTFEGLGDEGIQLHNVSFAYDTRKGDVLDKISFTIPTHRTTAIVGSSGAGKSTILDLLLRFMDPNEGAVTAAGVDLRNYDVISWRDKIGVVSQETFLFNTSVRENIRYGSPMADDEAVMNAAHLANIDRFIEELPDGLDTIIGDRGVMLSGGQRQRLAIARAVIREPEILIFDEATSSLDTVTEEQIKQAMDNVSKGRTVILVAHRLSTIQNADQIVVLDKGRVVDAGSHHMLMQSSAAYQELYNKYRES